MAPIIEVFEPRLFDGAVADEISASIEERLTEKKRCSVALSGGSTPGCVYRALSKPPRVESVTWPSVDLILGDERWVPLTDDQSNYRMIDETLLSQLKTTKPAVHPVDTSLKSCADSAKAYADTLRRVSGNPPQLDIVLLGVGEDGHTASLFPGTDSVHRHDGVCFAVKHPASGQERVTISPDVLFNAWRVFYIVKGESKADIIKRVVEGNESIDVLPSRLFTTAKAQVSFLLDSGAAQKLSKHN